MWWSFLCGQNCVIKIVWWSKFMWWRKSLYLLCGGALRSNFGGNLCGGAPKLFRR